MLTTDENESSDSRPVRRLLVTMAVSAPILFLVIVLFS
jgi:hypothetical protein